MASRKQFQSNLIVTPELQSLITEKSLKQLTEDDLKEQRVSFAFGNAPESDLITKESMLVASRSILLKRD